MIAKLKPSHTGVRCIVIDDGESQHIKVVLDYENQSVLPGKISCTERLLPHIADCFCVTISSSSDLILCLSSYVASLWDENFQLLFKHEAEEIIKAGCFGKYGPNDQTVVFLAIGCCIQGFLIDGSEAYWNIMQDTVCSIGLMDLSGGCINIAVGLIDGTLNVYREMIREMVVQEASPFVLFREGDSGSFSFTLENGSVGVYQLMERLWKFKGKHKVISQCHYVLHGKASLVISWSNGKVDLRSWENGDLLYKCVTPAVTLDLLIVEGKLVGFSEAREFLIWNVEDLASSVNHELVFEHTQDTLRNMLSKKQQLITQLDYIENRRRGLDVTPSDCRVSIGLVPPTENCQGGVEMKFEATRPVHMVVARCEKLFVQGTHVVRSSEKSNTLAMVIRTPKDVGYSLNFQVYLEEDDSSHLSVIECTRELAPFSMFFPTSDSFRHSAEAHLETDLSEEKIIKWFNNNVFLVKELSSGQGEICESFLHLRDSSRFEFKFRAGKITLQSDNLKILGDIVQSLAVFCGVRSARTHIRAEIIDNIAQALQEAEKLQSTNVELQLQIAAAGQKVKCALLRGADALDAYEPALFENVLDNVDALCNEIETKHEQKRKNQDVMIGLLRQVNDVIQNSANCHVGANRTIAITESRRLIREKQYDLVSGLLSQPA